MEVRQSLRRLVVANDSIDGMDVALEKAARIEHYSGADVLVAQTLYDRVAEEPADVLPPEERARLIEALKARERQGLRRLTEPFVSRVATLETRLLWDRDAASAIVSAAAEWQARLLIKPVSQHHPLGDYLHTPLDWALMRRAPCAVLISKRDSWHQPAPILAAVDIADETHEALCASIVQTAALLADVLGAPLHVVTAYPDLGLRVDELQVAPDFEGIKADMRSARRHRLAQLATRLGIDVAELHVVEGRAAERVPELANRLDAALTVLGTAAREGLRGLLLGNTAEQLINRLAGDLVTVREAR